VKVPFQRLRFGGVFFVFHADQPDAREIAEGSGRGESIIPVCSVIHTKKVQELENDKGI